VRNNTAVRISYSQPPDLNTAAEIAYDVDSGCITCLKICVDHRGWKLKDQMVADVVTDMNKEGNVPSFVWLHRSIVWARSILYGIGSSGRLGIEADDSWRMDCTLRTCHTGAWRSSLDVIGGSELN
jgi:hypothetical protein